MRVADRLVLDGAQPETLLGVVGRLLEPAIVEHQHLGLAIFEVEFAVVGAFEAAGEMAAPPLRSRPARSRSDSVGEVMGGSVVGLPVNIGRSIARREGRR